MSIHIMSICWNLSGISSTQKLVLLSLADQANDEGICWPSIATIQKRTSLTDRAVQKTITSLVELGHISKTERSGRSTYYTVHPRTTFTPALAAPLNDVHPTPEHCSPLPPNHVHPTPEPRSPITIIEPKSETKEKPQKDAYGVNDLINMGVDESVARDFMKVRKKRKADLTETALKGIIREADIAGYTLNQALQVCAERSWQGFKAEWVIGKASTALSTGFIDQHLDTSWANGL